MNTKLPIGSLSDIPRQDVKDLLKKNNLYLNATDTIKESFISVLNNNKKLKNGITKISSADFDLIDLFSADFLANHNGFSVNTNDIVFSTLSGRQILTYLIKLYNIKTLSEFKILYKKIKNIMIKIHYKEKNFEYMVKLCKTSSEFEKLCENHLVLNIISGGGIKYEYIIKLCKTVEELEKLGDMNLIPLMAFTKAETLDYVTNLYKISTAKEFMQLCGNPRIRPIISNAKAETLDYITTFFKITNAEEFEKLCENDKVREMMSSEKEVLNYANNLYKVTKIEEFKKLCENDKVRRIIRQSKQSNLNYMIKLYKITNVEEFEKLCENDKVREITYDAIPETLDYITTFFKITNVEEFEKLCENDKVRRIIFNSKPETLDYIIKLYNITTIEELELLNNDLILKEYLIGGKEKNIGFLTEIYYNEKTKKNLYDYLDKKVFPSKDNIRIVFQEDYDMSSENIKKLFIYYLQYKPKHLISMIKMLSSIKFFDIDMSFDSFKTLDDFKDENGIVQPHLLKENFVKILQLNGISEANIQKNCVTFDNLCKSKNNEEGLQKLLMENLIVYINKLYHHKLRLSVLSRIKLNLTDEELSDINFNDIDDKKYDNIEFLEACKMAFNPEHNKHQINKLLMDYLVGKFDNIEDMNQYNTKSNKEWIRHNLNSKQKNLRLSKNRQEFKVTQENNGEHNTSKENIQIRLHNHMEIAMKKINEINTSGYKFITEFSSPGSLVEYYNTTIKKQSDILMQQNDNLFADLTLQIESIQSLFQIHRSKKANTVVIERDLDPLKSLMMGNRVDGSCLSFDSTTGNYYSAISNTIDVNKGVYYLKDEYGTILGRCLLTIGDDMRLSRYKMYYKGNVDAPLDEYFDKYTINLAKDMKIELNGDESEVQNIECDYWYKDGVQDIN